MNRPVLLLADADEGLLHCLWADPELCPRRVVPSTDVHALTRAVEDLSGPDLLVVDTRDTAGDRWLDAARRARDCRQDIAVVAIPTHGSETHAIQALRAGLDDYHRRPLDVRALRGSVQRLRHSSSTRREIATRPSPTSGRFGELMGESPAMQRVRRTLEIAAATDSPVLVLGETGTGKDLVARLLHEHGARHRGRLVALNCAAIPDTLLESELFGHQRGSFTGATADRRGAFELAHGGTLFLDEIGDMSPYAQAKLLRVLETRAVRRLGDDRERATDFRLIAATHQDLATRVRDGRFRADLFYRLEVLRIDLPPLRERKQDLPTLCERFLDELGRRLDRRVMGFGAGALEVLLGHDWPGNVRELRNALESIAINLDGQRVERDNLPPHLLARFAASPARLDHERDRLLAALRATDWNKSRAAAELNWSRMTLYRKMSKYGLVRRSTRDDEPKR